MRKEFHIGPAEVMPTAEAILYQQGLPAQVTPAPPLIQVAEEAREDLASRLHCRGILAEVLVEAFAAILPARGFNAPKNPLAEVFPRAERLALFAVTCGPAVGDRIQALFAAHDYPLASALDAAASLAADNAARAAQDLFTAGCRSGLAYEPGVLRYSPGYCGWHVSGQATLFAALEPGRIGIRLNESYLMDPLKSVSGVIVVGRPEIHSFVNDYDFCEACTDHQCRTRIAGIPSRPGQEE